LRYVHKLQGNIFDQPTLSRIIRAALACIPMLGFLFALSATWSFPDANKWLQCGWLLTAIPGSIVVFATSAWLLGEKSLNFRTKR